eukprot:2392429-Pyramimonas_sp.AAC.1
MHHATVIMLQEVNPAGMPAVGSGSWVQAQSAGASRITSSGAAPCDGLFASDPRRARARQLPIPAGKPAVFAPTSGPTTLFGTPQSAGSLNSLQARFQSMRMDPQLYQALQATSPFASRVLQHHHMGRRGSL